MTISFRTKRVWMFREPVGEADLHGLARELTATGRAEQCIIDLVLPGSFEASSVTASVGGITALFHAYGVLQNLPKEGSWAGYLSGADAYSVAERGVFDRSAREPATGPLRIGTQHRLTALSGEQFRDHWWNSHASKVLQHMPGVTRYTQSYVMSCSPDALQLDGWYESQMRTPETLITGLFDSLEGERIMELDGDAMVDAAKTERASMHRFHIFPEVSHLERSLEERPR